MKISLNKILLIILFILNVSCESESDIIDHSPTISLECNDGQSLGCDDLWNVFYDVDVPIAGFQFDVNEGNIINASGGAATEAGLSISNSSATVIAFSLLGNTIPLGTGTLISLEIAGDSNLFCIKDLVLSNIGGDLIPAIIENCNTIKYSE